MVLTFVLTIFMIVQFVLRETISGQKDELAAFSAEVAALAEQLGIKESEKTRLEARLGAVTTTLTQVESELTQAKSQITAFEAQVAALLADQERARGNIAALESQRDELLQQRGELLSEQEALLSEQEALNLALAQSRTEIDAQAEAARLAAARREALEALIAELEANETTQAGQIAVLEANEATLAGQIAVLEANEATQAGQIAELEANKTAQAGRIAELEQQLTDEEVARLVEAAAAEALRNRLQNADAELTAMTLALEAKRKEAEETLILLAAAQAARAELERQFGELNAEELKARLQAALEAQTQSQEQAGHQRSLAEERAALLAVAQDALASEKEISTEAQRQTALLNQQILALRSQLGSLQALLDDYEERNAASEIQIQSLGQDLNAALARAASEERRRRLLEEAERIRLEAEAEKLADQNQELTARAEDLQRYRSEFFGRLRDVLGDQEGVRIEGDRFVFSSEVLFDTGSADLSAEGHQEVAKVANILRSVAEEIPEGLNWVIRVDGHTDNVPFESRGRYRDNWELSQGRALSVVRFMVDDLGIPPNRLAANGFGEFQPVNPADTPEARAQNRRIELKLTER